MALMQRPILWEQKDPFEPFDRPYAQKELASILMRFGHGVFVVNQDEFYKGTPWAAVINGLQCRGLLEIEALSYGAMLNCRVSQRGLDFLKEEA